jgi:hypothetical protein
MKFSYNKSTHKDKPLGALNMNTYLYNNVTKKKKLNFHFIILANLLN